MDRLVKLGSLCVLGALIVAAPSLWAFWIQDGVAVCTAAGSQYGHVLASDGAGGAIIAWEDMRSGTADIYARKVDVLGNAQWAADGVAICSAALGQSSLAIISDAAGGAIIAWDDYRGASMDIYAQRVNASGAVQWTANGVALCSAVLTQSNPKMVADGAGGAIVVWEDYRTGISDIYVQRVNASGAVQWAAGGVAICSGAGSQNNPLIISDGAGGAIIAWSDYRGTAADVYAQRVNASGVAQWTAGGVAVCAAAGNQYSPVLASDGAGGAVVAWQDGRGGAFDIYAQRVNASGAMQWTGDGVALCAATGNQYSPVLASDGAGGAIVVWEDLRSAAYYDIYAQRVNASGAVQWTLDGAAICAAASSQLDAAIVADGAGGAIVMWSDSRSGNSDTYAQRVNASGTMQWMANGIPVCTATGNQEYAATICDAAGNVVAAWYDYRNGNWDIYSQSIDGFGRIGLAADVLSVEDVPQDQGGSVRVALRRSRLDNAAESAYPVSLYNVWQRVDNPAALASLAREGRDGAAPAVSLEASPADPAVASSIAGWPVKALDGRYFVQSRELLGAGAFPAGTWELVGSFAACQQDEYIYRATTLADSAAAGIPYSVYFVTAHTTTPSVWFASAPDSGYSVDNIPPEMPAGLAAEQSYSPIGLSLSWAASTANDLAHYSIYRGSSEDFEPEPGNRIATPSAPSYLDGEWRWSSGYFYKVSAIDEHGNESSHALLTPDNLTGDETPTAPAASYLAQNFPNPFNPTTRIGFGLSVPGRVSIRIYDAAGRLVRVLIDEQRPAGAHSEMWDGRDARGTQVASGIYFYRLEAGAFSQTRKMALLR